MNILLKLLLQNYPLRDKEGYMPGERWGCQCGIEWLDEAEDLILLHTPTNTMNRIRRMFDMAVAG